MVNVDLLKQRKLSFMKLLSGLYLKARGRNFSSNACKMSDLIKLTKYHLTYFFSLIPSFCTHTSILFASDCFLFWWNILSYQRVAVVTKSFQTCSSCFNLSLKYSSYLETVKRWVLLLCEIWFKYNIQSNLRNCYWNRKEKQKAESIDHINEF